MTLISKKEWKKRIVEAETAGGGGGEDTNSTSRKFWSGGVKVYIPKKTK